MKLTYLLTLVWLVSSTFGSIAAQAAGDAKQGEEKALSCMGCHAIPGYNSVYPTYNVPRVGGQHESYVVSALKAYRSNLRSHRTMRAQAATLTDQDMADIAAYFASFADK